MKASYKILFLLALIVLNPGNIVLGQCNFQRLSQKCISNIHDGFIYVKSFNVNGENGKIRRIEYTYIMTKDTQYYLNICTNEGDTDGIIMTIYDSERNPVSTNYADNKFFPALIFQCRATGIYYISYTFKNSKNYCGESSLSFKK